MSKLHTLTADDVEYCDNKNRGSYTGLLQTFNKNLGDHVMTVLHDEGLYRHLRFKNPKNGFYWFDLITWPGNLTITGDMGTYTFARTEDMFTFFTGQINTGYWAEKLRAGASGGRSEVKNYDVDLCKRWIFQDFWEYSRDMDTDVTLEWWNQLKIYILGEYSIADLSSTESAIDTLRDLDMPKRARRHYSDVYEHADGWEQYDWHFELCLASIVAGIRTYNASKATSDE
ncbi:hypothetical protein [Glutamicibacter ardleyensis]|uniref:Uncharacterized protein n=1 Tax=Glutamicibacter ardleyensis TaxID=225894 RepID=A0ABQ2DFW5_9MICC|nr:hypothetical protein [Glutamicibacter ardleyensis]GGJ56127.1 hypothetical protein GCM10007173_13650 [Glutamicibacter ardleyensis]